MKQEQEASPQLNVPYGRKGYLPLQFMLKAVPKHIKEVDVTAKMKQIKQIMSPASQTATQSGKPLFPSKNNRAYPHLIASGGAPLNQQVSQTRRGTAALMGSLMGTSFNGALPKVNNSDIMNII
jgi:hypothetical protein